MSESIAVQKLIAEIDALDLKPKPEIWVFIERRPLPPEAPAVKLTWTVVAICGMVAGLSLAMLLRWLV